MKISLLKERENFNEILENTLTKYLSVIYGWKGELGFKKIENSRVFIVNDLLNVLYPYQISRSKLSPLIQEFTWHSNIIKKTLQKLYVFWSVRFPLEKIFSSSKFYLTDFEGLLEYVVIIPGNHSIRLVDTNKNICTVICKTGFNQSLLIKDAQVRLDNNKLNVPKVIELNSLAGWYQEQRVIGLPLNRLDSEEVKEKILIKCHNDLNQLYIDSLTKLDLSLFVKNIMKDINDLNSQIEPSLSNLFKGKPITLCS